MKRTWIAVAALVGVPIATHAQTPLQYPGFYISAEGGVNWMFNTTINTPNFGGLVNVYPTTGWLAGGSVGYGLVGPRFEIEGVYRSNDGTLQAAPVGFQNITRGFNVQQMAIMANAFYDFLAGGPIVPYVGAGLGVAFVNASAFGSSTSTSSTNFAYQGMPGVGWNIDPMFRVNLEGRYCGTTSPSVNIQFAGGVTFNNNSISLMASIAVRFGAPPAPPPPPAVARLRPTSNMPSSSESASRIDVSSTS